MISTQHTQSLTDFRQKATETLDHINKTGHVEILTVNGEARAVLLSPAVYDEMAREAQLSRDAAVIRQAMREIDEGKGKEAGEFFDAPRSQLNTMRKSKKVKVSVTSQFRETASRHHRPRRPIADHRASALHRNDLIYSALAWAPRFRRVFPAKDETYRPPWLTRLQLCLQRCLPDPLAR